MRDRLALSGLDRLFGVQSLVRPDHQKQVRQCRQRELTLPRLLRLGHGLSKTFTVTERLKLQLRGEFFNIFNRVNFLSDEGTVNNFSTLSNSTFGTLRTATDPRPRSTGPEGHFLVSVVAQSRKKSSEVQALAC